MATREREGGKEAKNPESYFYSLRKEGETAFLFYGMVHVSLDLNAPAQRVLFSGTLKLNTFLNKVVQFIHACSFTNPFLRHAAHVSRFKCAGAMRHV
jgi:hypothetical protein